MIDRKALLDDLKQQIKAVEADLGKQVKALGEVGARLWAEYDQARKLGRTAATWNSWLDERVTQVAVAWVLGSVFVRFCEDNRLIPEPYLTGPDGDRRQLAESRYDAYVEWDDDPTYRGWLEKAFDELGQGQAGRLLFDKRHNPLYQIPLSHDGARELVEFWRQRDEAGVLVHDFTDPLNEDGTEGWDTRFLGDLYQDLSEAARKTYALLQTPEFVEEFILDRTMNPAVREFGYEELKVIDPTCGSGNFVLGAFRRLVRLWAEGQPGRDVHERVRAALNSVHGVDINPFAVAIARFRLLVAAMAVSGVRSMGEASKWEWPINLAVGDSLMKARRPPVRRLNELYRELYDACAGSYALSVPFAQRVFELAKRGGAGTSGYGMVGQITASSFTKREFGVRLVEKIFGNRVELTEAIDTSGAYIPGHGTPTVILIGRNVSGKRRADTIRTVRGIQGEPGVPQAGDPGLVWRAILGQIDNPGTVSQWVSVSDLNRDRFFGKHPWILSDGGLEVNESIQSSSSARLGDVIEVIGRTTHTGLDPAYFLPSHSAKTRRVAQWCAPAVLGDGVRDYSIDTPEVAYLPYTKEGEQVEPDAAVISFLWPNRTLLRTRIDFGQTLEQRGLRWFDHSMFFPKRHRAPFAIGYAFVATHNHFVLERGGSFSIVLRQR
ncbi:BREX-2 system adenine-specific DNA-methyltransferase PglX [Streptomyces sp. SCL15-6]|uniref:BREX-2 system adenine-specific DNA-methyltransferase PglX n=1 Tax=Streptomyces sp. SCL15-6 TaxID=2967222 RepID=UPI00398FE3E1